MVPDDWRGAVIVTLDKGKGSQIDCASHKAISLISLGSKFYARILARRIQEKSERLLWEAQGGFRPGKGCMDQIFSLRIITKKFFAVNQKLFCASVDLEKAFDTVVKAKLWGNTSTVQCELQAVKSLYRNHSACVGVGVGMSLWFDIGR